MIPLPKQFEGRADQKGYVFRVLDRVGLFALIEKHNPAHESGRKYYEVVIVRQVPETTWPNDKTTEAREKMPSPAEWGSSGWSFDTLEAAREKYYAIQEQPIEL